MSKRRRFSLVSLLQLCGSGKDDNNNNAQHPHNPEVRISHPQPQEGAHELSSHPTPPMQANGFNPTASSARATAFNGQGEGDTNATNGVTSNAKEAHHNSRMLSPNHYEGSSPRESALKVVTSHPGSPAAEAHARKGNVKDVLAARQSMLDCVRQGRTMTAVESDTDASAAAAAGGAGGHLGAGGVAGQTDAARVGTVNG